MAKEKISKIVALFSTILISGFLLFSILKYTEIKNATDEQIVVEPLTESNEEEQEHIVSSDSEDGEKGEPQYKLETWEEGESLDVLLELPGWYAQEAEWTDTYLVAMQYQLQQPSHLLFSVDLDMSTGTENYRNISIENWKNEWGGPQLEYMGMLYLGDVVVDKYIREYGGEDGKYEIDCIEQLKDEQGEYFSVKIYRIYNEEVELEVRHAWYFGETISILVKDGSEAEVPAEREFFLLSKYSRYCMGGPGGGGYEFHATDNTRENKQYWMIVNPERAETVKQYRNVNPDENPYLIDVVGYYIADLAIDKYIRDYEGSNEVYQVELISREKDEAADGYIYHLGVSHGDELIKVDYSDYSWLVEVQIADKEN